MAILVGDNLDFNGMQGLNFVFHNDIAVNTPSVPVVGMPFYENDTKLFKIYNGSAFIPIVTGENHWQKTDGVIMPLTDDDPVAAKQVGLLSGTSAPFNITYLQAPVDGLDVTYTLPHIPTQSGYILACDTLGEMSWIYPDYEPSIAKDTGYLRYTGSAWEFLDESYSLSSHDHTGVYAPLIHNFIDTTNHPVSGLTTGHFLKSTGIDTYAFAVHGLTYSDVGAAASSHTLEGHTATVTQGKILKGTGSNTFGWMSMGTTLQVLRVNTGGTDLEWWTPTYGSSNVSVTNQGNDRIITSTASTDALNAEANLTFDGSELTIAGLREIKIIATGTDSGLLTIKGVSGGWSNKYGFVGSGNTYLGGFGAYGSTDTLTNFWIGKAYNDQSAKFYADGAVELYYDNAKKFETTSTGVSIGTSTTISTSGVVSWGLSANQGILSWDTGVAKIGGYTSNDLAIYAGNSEKIRVLALNGYVGVGTTNPVHRAEFVNSDTGAGENFIRVSKGYSAASADRVSGIILGPYFSYANLHNTWTIESRSPYGYMNSANLNFIWTASSIAYQYLSIASDGFMDLVSSNATASMRITNDNSTGYILQKRRSDDSQKIGLFEYVMGGIAIMTGNNARFYINSSGKVSIGVNYTPDTHMLEATSADNLQFKAISTVALGGSSGGGISLVANSIPSGANQRLGNIYFNAYYTGTTYSYAGGIHVYSSEAWSGTASGTYMTIMLTPNTTITRTVKMYINHNGYVAIGEGVSAPTYPLEVKQPTSQIYINSTTGTNLAMLRVNNTGGDFWLGRNNSTGTGLINGDGYSAVINAKGTYPLYLAVNDVIGITVNSTGYVGVGVTPTYPFHVQKSYAGVLTYMYNSNAAGYGLKIQNADDTKYALTIADSGANNNIHFYGLGYATFFYAHTASDYLTGIAVNSSGNYGGGIRISIGYNATPHHTYIETNSLYSNSGVRTGSTYADTNIVNTSANATYGSINFYTYDTKRFSIQHDGKLYAYSLSSLGSETKILYIDDSTGLIVKGPIPTATGDTFKTWHYAADSGYTWGTTDIVASSTDTMDFVPGSGIAITTDPTLKAIRISVTGSGGLTSAYASISDGTNTANASGGDTFYLNSFNTNIFTVVVSETTNDHATFTIIQADATHSGYLSSTDWSTFNNKVTMTYPGTGIALSTGSAWGTSITDNSANWNTAYGWGNHSGLYAPISHAVNDPTYGYGTDTVAGHIRKGNGITVTTGTFSIASHAGTGGSVGTIVIDTNTLGVSLGTTSTTACAGNDSRLSNSRTPTAHQFDSATYHTVSGLTTGHFLKATGATSFGFEAHGLTYSDVGAAATSHTHGNITNTGAIGATANLPIITTTSGVLTTGTFGTTASTFCEGNDSRLSNSRTPTAHQLDSATYHTVSGLTTGHFLKATGATSFGFAAHGLTYSDVGASATSHTHGNITNTGAIGATANLPIITTTSGVLTTGTFGTTASTFCEGNDSRLSNSRTPTAHQLDSATYHTVSGLTTGHFLKATGATSFGFAAHGLTYSDVGASATSHTHGNITNAGAIGATANLPVITTTSGVLTTGSYGLSFIGNGTVRYQIPVTGATPFTPAWTLATNLVGTNGLNSLSYASLAFVKMSAAGTFTLDTKTYLETVTVHNLLSATHGDTTASSVTVGALIVGKTGPKWEVLSFPGTPTGKFLRASGTDIVWSTLVLPNAAAINTIPYASTADNITMLSVSTTVGTFLRNTTVAGVPGWSTLVLPNAGTVGDIPHVSTTNNITMLTSVATAGSFLRGGGTTTAPAWSTVKLPATMSALGLWVANTANTTVNLTAAAGQSIRVNSGGTSWEAYTPALPVDSTLLDWSTDKYQPYGTKAEGALYTGTTTPDGTTRLNYSGYLYATKIFSGLNEVAPIASPVFTGSVTSPGYQSSWGSFGTGGFDVTMGDTSNTWLITGSRIGSKRGGIQLSEDGLEMRIYIAGPHYLSINSTGVNYDGTVFGGNVTTVGGTVNKIPRFTTTYGISECDLYWNASQNSLGVGGNPSGANLHVFGVDGLKVQDDEPLLKIISTDTVYDVTLSFYNNTTTLVGRVGYVYDVGGNSFKINVGSNPASNHLTLNAANGRMGVGAINTGVESLYINGDILINGDITASSDIREKNIICEFKDGLKTLIKSKPIYFERKNNLGKYVYGFNAQEIHGIYPEIGIYDKENDRYKVDSLGLSAWAFVAIKDLKTEKDKEIKELQKRVAELEREVELLK